MLQNAALIQQAVLGEQASEQLTSLSTKADLAMSNVEQLVGEASQQLKESGDLVDSKLADAQSHLGCRV